MFNNISVGWHVLGVIVIIALLIFVPEPPPERELRVRPPDQQHRLPRRRDQRRFFWLYVLPLGFILTMYTQTGYDASAHTAEETRGAAKAAAQGVWRSVFYSAIAGWAVLLALLFAATHVARSTRAAAARSRSSGRPELVRRPSRADHLHGRPALLRRGRPDQRLAHVVRVLARPGDAGLGAVPPGQREARAALRGDRRVGRLADHHHPGAVGNKAGVPWAYFAITAICTVGLYLAYIIPVYLRLRQGDNFEPGPWTLGSTTSGSTSARSFVVAGRVRARRSDDGAGRRGTATSTWTAFNYSPLVLLVGLIVGIWWWVGEEPLPRPGAHDRRGRVRGRRPNSAGRPRSPADRSRPWRASCVQEDPESPPACCHSSELAPRPRRARSTPS